MLTSAYGIQYQYTCKAQVSSNPLRTLQIWAWDRFGVVELLDISDKTEYDNGVSEDVDAWYVDLVQIPDALDK
jgi:hypothetical protein